MTDSPARRSWTAALFAHQGTHLVLLAALLAGLLAARRLPRFDEGSWGGIATSTWVVLAVAEAVLHQVYVWFCWRAELHGELLSRVFGRAAFAVYAVGFAVLIVARPVLLTLLALANRGTLELPPLLTWLAAAVATALAAATLVSTARHFGLARAFGIDHFDASWRTRPLVHRGVFRMTPNAMYVFGLLLLWVPGLALRSVAAVVVALFCHLYIWVHWHTTERPDMRLLYGGRGVDGG